MKNIKDTNYWDWLFEYFIL